jgi:hypothetical protein
VLAAALAVGCSLDDRAVAVVAAGGATGATSSAGGAGRGAGGADGGAGAAGDGERPDGCATRLVAEALITDFSDAVPISDDEMNPGLGFEVQGTVGGGQSFVYSSSGLGLPAVSLATTNDERALRFTAMPGAVVSTDYTYFVGFGLGWSAIARDCLDASGFRGLTFSAAGSIGSCLLIVGMQTSSNVRAELNAAGSCQLVTGCAPPQSAPLDSALGVFEVPFSDMHGGRPHDAVDPTSVIGVNWFLLLPPDGPPCEVDLLIDDVAFFR